MTRSPSAFKAMSQAPLDPSTPYEADFFKELADGAPVMIWMAGLDMGCFYFNRAWLEFRGRTLKQEFGNGWAEGVHPDDLQRCVQHYVSSFEQRQAFAMSYRLQNAKGEFHWILDRGAPHYLPDGTFLGFFGGCAATAQSTAIERNAQLGAELTVMQEAARRVAIEEPTLLTLRPQADIPLPLWARYSPEERLELLRRRQYAAKEMEQLATDMLSYRQIPNGACLN